jgi:hypothetical protein
VELDVLASTSGSEEDNRGEVLRQRPGARAPEPVVVDGVRTAFEEPAKHFAMRTSKCPEFFVRQVVITLHDPHETERGLLRPRAAGGAPHPGLGVNARDRSRPAPRSRTDIVDNWVSRDRGGLSDRAGAQQERLLAHWRGRERLLAHERVRQGGSWATGCRNRTGVATRAKSDNGRFCGGS